MEVLPVALVGPTHPCEHMHTQKGGTGTILFLDLFSSQQLIPCSLRHVTSLLSSSFSPCMKQIKLYFSTLCDVL